MQAPEHPGRWEFLESDRINSIATGDSQRTSSSGHCEILMKRTSS